MKLCFTIALWMFFLIGNLQAKSIMRDLGFGYLRDNVACVNVTFTYPINVDTDTASCRTEALYRFKDGLGHAKLDCQDIFERIDDTLDVLNRHFQSTNSTECQLETKTSQFTSFVDDLESFVQKLNAEAKK